MREKKSQNVCGIMSLSILQSLSSYCTYPALTWSINTLNYESYDSYKLQYVASVGGR